MFKEIFPLFFIFIIYIFISLFLFKILTSLISYNLKKKIFLILCFLILLFPIIFTLKNKNLQFIQTFLFAFLSLKFIDYFYQFEKIKKEKRNIKEFFIYVLPLPISYTFNVLKCNIRTNKIKFTLFDLRKIVIGLIKIILTIIVLELNIKYKIWNISLLLDHILKVLESYFIAEGLVEIGTTIVRCLGYEFNDVWRNPISAKSFSDFWRRLNVPVYEWLFRYIFLKINGVKNPTLGILSTFFVSGILHEYLFYIGTRKIFGYVLSFFLINGIFCAIEYNLSKVIKIKKNKTILILQNLFTIIFIIISAIPFFACIDNVIQIHLGAGSLLRN